MTTIPAAYVLLIADDQGAVHGVRFPSAEAAREWEDANADRLGEIAGCIPLVSKREALR